MEIRLQLPQDAALVPLCLHIIRTALPPLGVCGERQAAIERAMGELAGNMVRHAYCVPEHRYQLLLAIAAMQLRLVLLDESDGCLWSALAHPEEDPRDSSSLQLIEQLADAVTFSTTPGRGSRLEAEFRLHAS